jgi:hypothetical protein
MKMQNKALAQLYSALLNTFGAYRRTKNVLPRLSIACAAYVILLRTFQRARRFLLPILRLRLGLAIHISCV